MNPDVDCPEDILMLCNGVMNCDNCADEVCEHCMEYDCSGSMWRFLAEFEEKGIFGRKYLI